MFGIIYAATIAIVNAIGHTQEKYEDYKGKQRGIKRKRLGDNKENVYFDHRGCLRDINTNDLRDIRMENGEWVLKDGNLNILRNLSEEEREIKFEKNKRESASNIKAVYYKHWSFNNTPIKKNGVRITGDVYRDINNDKLYFIRRITWNKDDLSEKPENKFENGKIFSNGISAEFYLDPYTAEIVDVSDKWKENNKIDVKEINKFICHFNTEQRKGGWRHMARKYGSVKEFYVEP